AGRSQDVDGRDKRGHDRTLNGIMDCRVKPGNDSGEAEGEVGNVGRPSCAGIAVRRTACFRTPMTRASMMSTRLKTMATMSLRRCPTHSGFKREGFSVAGGPFKAAP